MKNKTILLILMAVVISAAAVAQSPKKYWTNYDGNKVYFYDIGNRKSKTALILIHGWTCSADFWKDSFNAFPKYRVIAIDLPGHGQSDKPKVDYTMQYFARSIEAVMKEAKIEKAVLVGHSMGTPVIRQFYRLYPEQTLGLVVVDGPLRPFGPRAQMEKFFEPMFVNYGEQGPKFIDGLLGTVRADLRPSIRPVMVATPDYVSISAMKAMLDDAIWTDDKINVPVLAIMAKNPMYPPNIEDGYRAVAPNLEFKMWDGVSHFLMMEKPKEFNEVVSAFVEKNKLL
ncbi:MAG TPA: alpha/beta hydrolase [Pyrinomonadaceae bacterium]|jgi:pimeloyl-ACP methyl ester carboxylesterase|nr:alpha/beta hydrolase [Pyrinomonadaceae bacterium]